MPTRVKICGVKRWDDALLSVELGADALGFNFYPASPRYLAPADAREIIHRLPPFVTAVGVFADETDAAHIKAVADGAGVSVVQLHGPKFPPDGTLGRYSVIRAISVGPAMAEGLPDKAREGMRLVTKQLHAVQSLSGGFAAGALLLDTDDPLLRGGTGRTFDWNVAGQVARQRRVILAGGLTPENVGEAIKQVRPYAVDVATGVECAPGVKDPARLKAFFKAVHEADRSDRFIDPLDH